MTRSGLFIMGLALVSGTVIVKDLFTPPEPIHITNGLAIDGDTFVAAGVHYRLLAMDAPELPGHCRPGRKCVEGDPYKAKWMLQLMLEDPAGVICYGQSHDVYGRQLVRCFAETGHQDFAETLIAGGWAQPYRR